MADFFGLYTGCVFGHSFVSRLSSHLGHRDNHLSGLGLSSICSEISVKGKSGAKIDDMVDFFLSIQGRNNFDFLIIDIGTNDLCGDIDGKSLAQDIISRAWDLLSITPTLKHISFILIVKRLKCRGKTVHEFDLEKDAFNNEIMSLCSGHSCFSFLKLRLDDDQINIWSYDGIHPSTEVGKKRYIMGVRNQAYRIVKKLEALV